MQEVINVCMKFVSQLELGFPEYIKHEHVQKLKDYLKSLETDETLYANFLKETVDSLSCINFNKLLNQKNKTRDFIFLDDIKLFNNGLEFKLFTHENKNTKRTLVQNLQLIYQSCKLVNQTSETEAPKFLDDLMKDETIMELANDVSNELVSKNVDPMTLLTSLLQGTSTSSESSSLIDNITTKVKSKIDNGEINTKNIEKYAKSFMDNLMK